MKNVFRLLVILCITSSIVHAQVPQLLEYDGFLSGNVSGNRTIGVRLYNASTNGTLLYSENIGAVNISQGQFYFQYGQNGTLGNGTIPTTISAVLTGGQHWLGITINGTEQTPRERLVAVPFALRSADAQSLRDELITAGLLKPTPTLSDPTFVFCVNTQSRTNSVWYGPVIPNVGKTLNFLSSNSSISSNNSLWRPSNSTISFEQFINQRLASNDRILTYNYDLLKEAAAVSNYFARTKITLNFVNGALEPAAAPLRFYIAIPQSQGTIKTIKQDGYTITVGAPFTREITKNAVNLIKYNGIIYNVYQLFNEMRASTKLEIYLNPSGA
jgi:hypothetical protein